LGMIVPELSKMQMLKGKASPAISMVIYLWLWALYFLWIFGIPIWHF
jgi:hypothetical protein